MSGCADIKTNMQNIREAVEKASEMGADFLCLPENCHSFTTDREKTKQNLEYLTGESMKKYQKMAKDHNLSISIGGFPEKISEDSPKFHNTHILINSSGEIEAVYRKIHLFDINIDEKNKFFESEIIAPGKETVVSNGIGLSICYDLRFPELYRELSEKGAKIMLVPSAFLQKTGEAHWEVLLRARAIENQCFVIAAAQTGNLENKRDSYGRSLIIDPWGKILLAMKEEVGVEMAELNFEELDSIREKLPSLKHKRNDLFEKK